MITLIRLILLMALIPAISFAAAPTPTIPYYQGWENNSYYPLNAEVDDASCEGWDVSPRVTAPTTTGLTENCNVKVRDDTHETFGEFITDRGGAGDNRYLEMDCFYDASAELRGYKQLRAGNVHIEGWSTGDTCHSMRTNDGTEYWIGWSLYIPADYYEERQPHAVYQWHTNDEVSFTIRYGQSAEGPNDLDSGFRIDQLIDGDFTKSYVLDWTALKGSWVDFVLHTRVYKGVDSANAVLEVFINGVNVWDNNGVMNVGTMLRAQDPYMNFFTYNTNTAVPNDESCIWVWQCETDHHRTTYMDEFRLYEQIEGDGDNDYCDVAPPIWSKQRAILYPTDGAGGVGSSFTLTYAGYLDHRTDPQTCFAYEETEVQVQEADGNWTTLVHDSTSDAETSKAITGLDEGTTYDARIRHSSVRSGSTDTYNDEWSEVITFTTSADIAVSPGLGTSPMIQ